MELVERGLSGESLIFISKKYRVAAALKRLCLASEQPFQLFLGEFDSDVWRSRRPFHGPQPNAGRAKDLAEQTLGSIEYLFK